MKRETPAMRRAGGPPDAQPVARPMRIQKFLSDAGVASRRRAEEMIEEGRVLLNDEIVQRLPAFVDPQRDRVIVDGQLIRTRKHQYFIAHKPKGVLCTNHDPAGRTRAIDLLPPGHEHLFPVGRLDADSSGLLLMTNDGELAQRMTHPRYGMAKVYRVEVKGRVTDDLSQKMREGVYLAEGKARALECRVVHAGDRQSALLVTLNEALNRQVRRMLAKFGLIVKDMKRVQIGPLTIRELPLGASRELSPRELNMLRAAVAGGPTAEVAIGAGADRPSAAQRKFVDRPQRKRPDNRPTLGRTPQRAGPRDDSSAGRGSPGTKSGRGGGSKLTRPGVGAGRPGGPKKPRDDGGPKRRLVT